jgi:ribose transport system substrate-binding protein
MGLKNRWAVCAAVAAGALTLGACGSSDSGSGSTTGSASGGGKDVAVDVGGGKTVQTGGKPLKIALFAAGTNNSYLIAQNDEARKVAKEKGLTLDVFDGKFDPAVQYNQMQSALVGGKYNAWIVQAIDGQQVCQITSQQAPDKNVVVSAMVVALCGRAQNEGEELWAPGTLNFIGGNETVEAWKVLWQKAVDDNPGPQTVGVLTGPKLNSITIAYLAAMKQVIPKDWKVVDVAETDYSVPTAQAKAQTLVQAHPDLSILMSTYTNITKGAVAALKAAGRLDKVKVYDGGGTKTGVQYVKDGTTQATTARYSRSPVDAAIDSLQRAWAGKTVPRYVPNDGHADEPGRKPDDKLFLVTKQNADDYTPEND